MKHVGAFAALAFAAVAHGTTDSDAVPPVLATAGWYSALPGADGGSAVAVDAQGNAYVAGTAGIVDQDGQAFVAKFAPDGTLLYELHFGGDAMDSGRGIAVDAAGEAYVCGFSTSPDFPVTVGPQGSGAFVAKIAADGSKVLFARLVATGDARAMAIALDPAGDAYVCGRAGTSLTATAGALRETNAGMDDAFAAKIAADGSAVLWATFLGGSGDDRAEGIAVDASGSAYVVGVTQSEQFPLPVGAPPSGYGDWSMQDGFLVKLAPDGSHAAYVWRLASERGDDASAVAVDAAGAAYVAGSTSGAEFPRTYAPDGVADAGAFSAFATKIRPDGSGLAYSVLLPGGESGGYAIAVGPDGAAYVAGVYSSRGTESWRSRSAIQWFAPDARFGNHVFASRLSPDGSRVTWTTVVGGGDNEYASGVALAPDGSVVVTGSTGDDPPLNRGLGGASDPDRNVLYLRLAPQDTWLSVARAFASDGRANRDALSFAGTHGFREHADFDPRVADVTVTVAAGENRRSLRIPAADPGWRSRADGGVGWRSPADALPPRWRIEFGPRDGIRVRVDHAGFNMPIDEAVTLDVAVGSHRASYARIWQRVRRQPERWLPRLK